MVTCKIPARCAEDCYLTHDHDGWRLRVALEIDAWHEDRKCLRVAVDVLLPACENMESATSLTGRLKKDRQVAVVAKWNGDTIESTHLVLDNIRLTLESGTSAAGAVKPKRRPAKKSA